MQDQEFNKLQTEIQKISDKLDLLQKLHIKETGRMHRPTGKALTVEEIIDDRVERASLNCKWLIEQIDKIHDALCPGQFGTWQDRARQCVVASNHLAKKRKVMRGGLEQFS